MGAARTGPSRPDRPFRFAADKLPHTDNRSLLRKSKKASPSPKRDGKAVVPPLLEAASEAAGRTACHDYGTGMLPKQTLAVTQTSRFVAVTDRKRCSAGSLYWPAGSAARSKDCSGVNFGSLILRTRSQSPASPPCEEALLTCLRQCICALCGFDKYYMQLPPRMQACYSENKFSLMISPCSLNRISKGSPQI